MCVIHRHRAALALALVLALSLALSLACSPAPPDAPQQGEVGDGGDADVNAAVSGDGTSVDAAGDSHADSAGSAGCAGRADGAACEDGDPCTLGDRCIAAQCVAGLSICDCLTDADCSAHEDGDLCNGTLVCSKQRTCVVAPATVIHCDPREQTVCTTQVCHPTKGICAPLPRPDGTPCAGQPCWPLAACVAGVCSNVSGGSKCQCSTSADCAAYDDNNLCNGVLYCDTAVFPGVCKVNPASLISCMAAPAGSCLAVACAPETGACVESTLADATPCDDGDGKTSGDQCKGGVCVGQQVGSCAGDADCKDDLDLCNGTPYCDLASKTCKTNPATLVSCPSVNDTACQHNVCSPTLGKCFMTAVQNGKGCDDGDPCTEGDSCIAGACVAGTKA